MDRPLGFYYVHGADHAFNGIPVRSDVAMTARLPEIRVLPIGGLREKSLAALRRPHLHSDCTRQNAKDLDEIPRQIRRAVEFQVCEAHG